MLRPFVPRVFPLVLLLFCSSLGAPSKAAANTVTDWNAIWLDCIRATGGGPGPIARAGAMVHAAMFDAVVAIEGGYLPYASRIPAKGGASPDAAAAQAAHDVLVALYPERVAIFDAALANQLAPLSKNARQAGTQVGSQAALSLLRARENDGSSDATPYVGGSGPGDWQPAYPDFSPAIGPNWGRVKPWVLESGAQFRPKGPFGLSDPQEVLRSPGYARVFDDVKEFGSRTSARRSAYQTQTAFFWANDANGTYKPPGHLNHIAQVLTRQQDLSLLKTARLFALLNLALADAGIVAWDCKYEIGLDFWRPITGIRQADLDDNIETIADPSWEPLNAFTPAFPAYVSGHATFASAAAAVFKGFFGTDRMRHTISTDDPLYQGGPRTYFSFSQAAEENARSRIYLGVHWQFDADDGLIAGRSLGEYVTQTALQEVSRPGRDALASTDATVLGLRTEVSPSGATIQLAQPLAGRARVIVLDVQGRKVVELFDGTHDAGTWSVSWNGRDAQSASLKSGVFFVLAEAAGYRRTEKLVLLK